MPRCHSFKPGCAAAVVTNCKVLTCYPASAPLTVIFMRYMFRHIAFVSLWNPNHQNARNIGQILTSNFIVNNDLNIIVSPNFSQVTLKISTDIRSENREQIRSCKNASTIHFQNKDYPEHYSFYLKGWLFSGPFFLWHYFWSSFEQPSDAHF